MGKRTGDDEKHEKFGWQVPLGQGRSGSSPGTRCRKYYVTYLTYLGTYERYLGRHLLKYSVGSNPYPLWSDCSGPAARTCCFFSPPYTVPGYFGRLRPPSAHRPRCPRLSLLFRHKGGSVDAGNPHFPRTIGSREGRPISADLEQSDRCRFCWLWGRICQALGL